MKRVGDFSMRGIIFMKNFLLLPALIIFMSLSLQSQDNIQGNSLNVDEILHFEEMLSVIKDNIKFLNEEQIETGDMKNRFAEAENLFFTLKNSADIKDFELMKRYLNTIVSELAQESGDRVTFVQRMELLYWMMLSIGLVIVFMILVYSIVMYSRRK